MAKAQQRTAEKEDALMKQLVRKQTIKDPINQSETKQTTGADR